MTAVTQRIDNYLGGVSRQSDDKKLPGQVKECLNGYPDPTFGLTKRPGLKWIANLSTSSIYDSAKWFYISRDATNKYIGCITPKPDSSNGTIAVWNAISGAACSMTYGSGAQAYLTGDRDNYHVLNLQDTSIITNNLITAAMQAAPSFTAKKQATLELQGTSISQSYSITINGVAISSIDSDSDDTYSDALDRFKTQIDAASSSNSWSLTTTKYKTTLHISRATAFTISASGGSDGSSLTVFQDQVDTLAELPNESFNGHTVKITNTAATEDTYWVKFVADDGTSGVGYWDETIDPSVSVGVTDTTVPHELVLTGTNAFTFRKITWTNRLVGDDVTNEPPQFIGEKIEQTFYHNNRLGFLSEDNVDLTQVGKDNRFNLWHISAKVVTDSDPIGLKASTIRPAALKAVIPTTQGLVLFSKNQQFLMTSESGVLTPSTATIRSIANYETDIIVDPVETGTHINFVSKTPSYTRVFAMQTRGQDENPQVLDVGKIVNEWVPSTIDTLIASPQNEFIALSSQSSKKVYFYRTYFDGSKNLMEAWFNWEVCGTTQAIAVDEDDMLFVTKQGSQFTFSKASLSQSPEDAIITSNKGQKINPCIDLYATANSSQYKSIETITITNGGTGYSSAPTVTLAGTTGANAGTPGSGAAATATVAGGAVTSITLNNGGLGFTNGAVVSFSGGGGSNAAATAEVYDGTKCYLRHNDDTALTPVLIIKGTAAVGQLVESGFTITPDRASDGLGPYFKVPRKDLTSVAGDIILGFKYDYDITLPKIYYRLGDNQSRSDFSARLTIARMKFAVGLSGVMGFKLKSTGIRQGKRVYVGDESTTDFSWIEDDIAYVDRDQIKLKINNFESTSFTFVNDTTIRLDSIPSETKTANGVLTTFDWTFDRDNLSLIKVLLETGVGTNTYTEQVEGTNFQFTGEKSVIFVDGNGAPSAPSNNLKIKIYSADDILIYLDEWYDLNPVPIADTYLANDVAISEQSVFSLPIHQRCDNFELRLFNDSPFPVALNSMMWEGNYSPRYYRRT